MRQDPATATPVTRRSSKGSDVLTIFCTNSGGGDFEQSVDCHWEYAETTEGHVMVWVELLDSHLNELHCGKPKDYMEQVQDELSRLYEFKNLSIEKIIIL